MAWLTAHFTEEEFRCKCGCDNFIVDLPFIKRLEKVRDRCNFPFTVNSGFRCPEYNAKKGGKKRSAHLVGKGVDIACTHSFKRWMIVFWAIHYGFKRIGIGKTFVHLDTDAALPEPRIWLY